LAKERRVTVCDAALKPSWCPHPAQEWIWAKKTLAVGRELLVMPLTGTHGVDRMDLEHPVGQVEVRKGCRARTQARAL